MYVPLLNNLWSSARPRKSTGGLYNWPTSAKEYAQDGADRARLDETFGLLRSRVGAGKFCSVEACFVCFEVPPALC